MFRHRLTVPQFDLGKNVIHVPDVVFPVFISEFLISLGIGRHPDSKLLINHFVLLYMLIIQNDVFFHHIRQMDGVSEYDLKSVLIFHWQISLYIIRVFFIEHQGLFQGNE